MKGWSMTAFINYMEGLDSKVEMVGRIDRSKHRLEGDSDRAFNEYKQVNMATLVSVV